MSSIPRQLATVAAVLAVLYTGGFVAGQLIDAGTHGGGATKGHGSEGGGGETTGHGSDGGGGHGEGAPSAAEQVRGLAVADDGLRLALETPELRRGRPGPLRFSITGRDGRAVRDFDVAHERRMHLIVVRRDLTGFQHLHPQMDAGGPAAEREAELRFTIARDGQPVRTQPYLGAGGLLVALREGDLAFLHLHPTEHRDDGIAFAATFPTEGRYRLFLQFKDRGRVHTVAFTQAVSR